MLRAEAEKAKRRAESSRRDRYDLSGRPLGRDWQAEYNAKSARRKAELAPLRAESLAWAAIDSAAAAKADDQPLADTPAAPSVTNCIQRRRFAEETIIEFSNRSVG